MNKFQKKVSKIALNRYNTLVNEIQKPVEGKPYLVLNLDHPLCWDVFDINRTIRRYKKEARMDLKKDKSNIK